ncbi:MAG: FAD:protein FMN transferase [Bryobacteraceae bacterium]
MRAGAVLALFFLPAMSAPAADSRFEAVEPAMGTLFRITLYAPGPEQAKIAFSRAFALAHQLDDVFSDYRPSSELNRLCRAGNAAVSPPLFDILTLAHGLARETGGAFDPTAGPVVKLWREARANRALPAAADIDAALRRTGWRKVSLKARRRSVRLGAPDMQLDLGGIAKGWAADRILAELRRLGFPRALVAASGDIAAGDPPPGLPGWRIAVAGGRVEVVRNAGVSTSGDAEQFVVLDGVRYSHIIDPRSGWALRDSSPVTVIAKNAALSDALATALSVDPHLAIRRAHKVRILR